MRIVALIQEKNPASQAKFVDFLKLFFVWWFNTLYKQKFSYLRQLLSMTFPKDSKHLKSLDIELREVGANLFCAAILQPLLVKVFKSETTSSHYFSPRILNFLKIWKSAFKVGAKRRLNVTSKVKRYTDRHTDIWTNRLIESIGPEGWCFENCDTDSTPTPTYTSDLVYRLKCCMVRTILHTKKSK